jgi:hypothetical protein
MTTSRSTGAAVALTIAAPAAAGILLGVLSAHLLFGGTVLVLIPWAAVCAVIGGIVRPWPLAAIGSAVFGFSVSMTFLVGGYEGDASLASVLAVFAALALAGAAIAAAFALAVNRGVMLLRRAR